MKMLLLLCEGLETQVLLTMVKAMYRAGRVVVREAWMKRFRTACERQQVANFLVRGPQTVGISKSHHLQAAWIPVRHSTLLAASYRPITTQSSGRVTKLIRELSEAAPVGFTDALQFRCHTANRSQQHGLIISSHVASSILAFVDRYSSRA